RAWTWSLATASGPRPAPSATPFPYTTLFRSFQRAKVVAHDIPQPQRDVVAFQRPVGRVAVIPKDLIVWHKRLSGWVLSKFTFLRSEEHTSELQSREKLVCRLLLETKNGAVRY